MSDKTTALLNLLAEDLSSVLDADQLRLMKAKDSHIWPDATEEQAQAYFLGRSLVKKYNDQDEPSVAACKAALVKFHEGNDACRDWELKVNSLRDSELIQGVKNTLDKFWHCRRVAVEDSVDTDGVPYRSNRPLVGSYNELYAAGRLGPGSNVGCRDVDLYTKLFDSPLSYTKDDLAYLWAKLAGQDPRWANAEKHRNHLYGLAQVAGNKLGFVNKNVTVARSISSEPTINMWFQLGLGAHLEEALQTFFGISIRGPEGYNQPSINRELAKFGSATGRMSTIDLANASNSISRKMLEVIAPAGMLAYMNLIRSPRCMLPDGTSTELHMVATMGNGFCFPLQTAIFAAVVVTAYDHLGIKPQGRGPALARNYGVFGDDIICRSEASRLVIHLLGLLGFETNVDKTFVEGPFRESCGGDFWYGRNCRGVFIKKLRTRQDAWAAVNALNRWSARTGIALPRVCGYILRGIRRLNLVPLHENDDAGLHVPLGMARASTPYPGLHRYDADVAATVRLEITPTEIRLEKRWEDKGYDTKERSFSEDALYLCFLHGSIRRDTITLRQRNTVYLTTKRISPCWDKLGADAVTQEVTWERLATAVWQNIASLSGV